MELSVLIPCFNEEKNVERFDSELFPVLDALDMTFEVIAVDDGSSDGTRAALRRINRPEMRVEIHEKNKGIGAAIRTGIDAAAGVLTIMLDSDLTFHPRLIPDLLVARKEHPDADVIIGSPTMGGFDDNIPKWRVLVSRAASGVYNMLLGKKITAVSPIFRLYRTKDLQALHLSSVGFDITTEIIFKLVFSGKTFFEIPAALTQRIHGESKLRYSRELKRHLVLIGRILRWKFFGYRPS